MKTTLHFSVLFLVFLGQQLSIGCPDCNVFNFLYPSVRSSPNIVIGTVTGQVNESTASVRVDRVLRGTNQIAQTAHFRLYNATNHVGKQLLFSDPTECCPDFPALPVDGEWEVGFLIGGAQFEPNEPFSLYSLGAPDFAIEQTPAKTRPRVKDVNEAILCLKGVSIVTREFGIQFAKAHQTEMLAPLQKELQMWLDDLSRAETNSLAAHRLEGLVQGLWIADTNIAQKFFAANLAERFGRPSAMVRTNIPQSPMLEAAYLCSVLQLEKTTNGHGKFQTMLLEGLPNLRNQTLVSAIYALGYSDSSLLAPVDRITRKIVQQSPDQKLSAAIGFYQIGIEKAQWWSWANARESLALARKYCEGSDGVLLADLIDKQLSYIDGRNKR